MFHTDAVHTNTFKEQILISYIFMVQCSIFFLLGIKLIKVKNH